MAILPNPPPPIIPLMAEYPNTVVMVSVILEISEGILSGIITFTIICIGEAPMLWAVSMILGFTSRKLLSTKRATKGKAAITSGTMDAGVPTTVPITNLVKGKTKIIKIKNGIERSKLMIIFKICSIHFGIRNTLPFSPATSSTPKGSPITMAKKVAITVT